MTDTTTATYLLTGMTCDHCVAAVREEIGLLEGVRDVAVGLVPGGVSQVRIDSVADLSQDTVRDAVAEAGYDLVEGRP